MTSLRRHSRGADNIELSNSTANLFMGAGARKNWMLAQSSTSTSPSPSLPTASGHAMRPTLPTTSAIPRPDSNSHPNSNSAPDANKHAHPQQPALDPASALMSPVTPGANLPAPLQDATHHQPQPLPQSDIPPPSLPSPVLSASSHASPDIPHPLATGTTLSDNDQNEHASENENENENENETSRPHQQLDITPLAQPSPIATSTPTNTNVQSNAQSPPAPRQEPMVASHHQPQNTARDLTQSHVMWLGWQPGLNTLLEIGQKSTAAVNARAMLLQKAFQYRDHFYLVLHQVHCRWAVSGYQDFPEFQSPAIRQGFRKLNELLTDNALIPHDVMSRFVAFPRKYEDLKDADWYRMDFGLLNNLLPRLPSHFVHLVDRINRGYYHARRYPPLIVEMRADLQLTSPVLLSVIFTSTCRHIYPDEYLPLLQGLFEKDLAMNHADSEKFRHVLIQNFQRIPMKPFDSAPQFQPAPRARPPRTSTSPFPVLPSQMNLSTTPQNSTAASVPQNHQPPTVLSRRPSYASPTTIGSPQMWQAPSGQMQQPTQMQKPESMHYSNGQSRSGPMQQLVNMPTQAQSVSPLPQNPHSLQLHNGQIRQNHQSQMGQGPQAHHAIQAQRVASVPNLSYPQHGVPHAPFLTSQPQAHSTAPHQPHMQFNSNNPQQMSSMGHPQLQSPIQPYHGSHGSPQIPHSQQVRQQRVASVPTVNTPTVPFVPPPSSRQPSTSLLPPLGYRVPQLVQPNPMRLSLHQVDLRDPIKKLVHWDSSVMVEKELFFYMNGFAIPPKFMDLEETSCNWSFQVSATDLLRATRLVNGKSGKRPTAWYQEGSLSLRLRSIALGNLEKDKVYDTWPTANTAWPSVFYIHVNGTELFVRRKTHNGKDLPLDITQHLKEGENTLSLHFLLEPGESKKYRYVFGIERMETHGFDKVRQQACSSPARGTLQKIQKRLCPIAGDDDELAVVSDRLTVSLIDPFMAQIYNIPARSVHCDHLECFDIDTFINTRKSESGPAPMNDNWQCPICKADARPMHLIIDEYFVDVREKLISSNKLEGTIAIDVRADGSWTTKVVSDEHSDRHASDTASAKRKATSPLDREASRAKQELSPPIGNTEHTVIEID